jgi:hypothetical protein
MPTTPPPSSSVLHTPALGRLILEASQGRHGSEAKELSEELIRMLDEPHVDRQASPMWLADNHPDLVHLIYAWAEGIRTHQSPFMTTRQWTPIEAYLVKWLKDGEKK